ncbi:MAG: hypothetical protein ISS43_02850 [Candidatus Omnitrophica bacterium]|nr:hypothetical protein [Candidatus Omnitrophota bacterium]
MNPALPKTPCKAIDMLGYGIKRKGGVNPALPKLVEARPQPKGVKVI